MSLGVTERWEQGIPHDPRSEALARRLDEIDRREGAHLDLRFGGDGDNGEELMYLLDVYFAEEDQRGERAKP